MKQQDGNNAQIRCAIYARYSNPSEASVKTQIEICQAFSRSRKWRVTDMIIEEGQSAISQCHDLKALLRETRP